MTLETAIPFPSRPGTQIERACIVFLQSELDIALGFLRLAAVETETGNTPHADDLIAKATNSYKAVLNGLPSVSLEFLEERQILREGLRLLQDAIRAAARCRQQQDNRLHCFG